MGIKKVRLADGSSKWEATFYTNGRYGKKIRKRFEKKIDAEAFLKGCETQKDERGDSDAKILEEVYLESEIEYWLKVRGPSFTEGTFRSVNPALNAIRKYCGNIVLAKITLNFIHNFRATLRSDGLSVATQNRYIETLMRILNFSFHEGRILKSPVVGYRSLKESKQEMNFWSEDDVERFLRFADRKYPPTSSRRWIFVAYLFALETGVRARELWGVQFKDLDLERFTVRISRQCLRKSEFAQTKGKNERVVPVSKTLKGEILALLKGRDRAEETIFLSQTCGAIDHKNFVNRVFFKDVKESKVKRIRFHDLRHTAITLLVKQNISPWIVQRIAGHADLKTTMRYVHIVGKDVELIGGTRSSFGEFALPCPTETVLA